MDERCLVLDHWIRDASLFRPVHCGNVSSFRMFAIIDMGKEDV